jgi:hypothetical protein
LKKAWHFPSVQVAPTDETLMRWRLLLRRCRRWRELGFVNGHVLMQLVDLDREAVAGAGQGPAVGELYSVGFAVVGEVDLGGEAP